jgi:hypothetical protein
MTFQEARKRASKFSGIERSKFLWFEAWKAATAEAEKRAKTQIYKITLSLTADGNQQCLQIISEDNFNTNIVLIGDFELRDLRQKSASSESEDT